MCVERVCVVNGCDYWCGIGFIYNLWIRWYYWWVRLCVEWWNNGSVSEVSIVVCLSWCGCGCFFWYDGWLYWVYLLSIGRGGVYLYLNYGLFC